MTIAAICNIGDADSKSVLFSALHDSEANVQWSAAIGLARMGDGSGKNILLQLLNRDYFKNFPEVDPEEQMQISLLTIDASAKLNDPQLNERLKNLASSDQSMKIRAAAQKVIKN